MFNHIVIGSNDLARSRRFYDQVLRVLGVGEATPHQAKSGHMRLFYRHAGGTLGIAEPINDEPATAANGGTIAFRCASPEQVHAFHDTAVANGGVSIEEPPGLRVDSLGQYYLAYVRDPDGNKLCAVHRPQAQS
ncbi:VOC family protein [Roseateles chitosanitabidus]|uniref:VOC family protein n=1 Tax=Roseateles chitosanitabidus TaxID=65048 RepID=UPI000834C57B|nr:VOC family protein [Roseateles chitosanitabidus]